MMEETYLSDVMGIISLIATIVAWIIGILLIVMGKKVKNEKYIKNGLAVLIVGSIPYMNAIALILILTFIGGAVINLVFEIVGSFIARKIIGK